MESADYKLFTEFNSFPAPSVISKLPKSASSVLTDALKDFLVGPFPRKRSDEDPPRPIVEEPRGPGRFPGGSFVREPEVWSLFSLFDDADNDDPDYW